ncbi:MAG: RrF2 family transcriptional regulator [Planctomycetota bacterium]
MVVMGFTSRSHYGTRAMLELALREGEGPVQLEKLSRVQSIPERYLSKLVQELRRAGFIRSVRGAHGGYMLAKPADEVCLLDIVRCLDGSVAPTECVESPDMCDNTSSCVAREVWADVNDAIEDVLGSMTLHDLAEEAKKRDELDDQDDE